jgi:hypothetical protein
MSTLSTVSAGRGASSPVTLLAAVRDAVWAPHTQADPVGARGWEVAERESAIAALDAVIQELTVYRGRVLVAHKEDGRWGSSRDRDYVDWRARMTGSGRGTAAGELAVAEGLDAMPEVARAVDTGALSIEHARALARLRADASEEVRQALDDGVTAELVERAKRKKLTAPELAKEARRHAARIDAQAAQDSYDATWRRRSVTFGKAAGGGRSGQWVLDDVGGTLVETALDAVVGPISADDDRSRAQRHADALVTLASRTLQVASDLNGAQVRPHLALVVSEETWAAAGAPGRRRRLYGGRRRPGPGRWLGVRAAPRRHRGECRLGGVRSAELHRPRAARERPGASRRCTGRAGGRHDRAPAGAAAPDVRLRGHADGHERRFCSSRRRHDPAHLHPRAAACGDYSRQDVPVAGLHDPRGLVRDPPHRLVLPRRPDVGAQRGDAVQLPPPCGAQRERQDRSAGRRLLVLSS